MPHPPASDATTHYPGQDTATRAACLSRLAADLSAYPDLDLTIRADEPAPCLAVRNITVPALSETVTVCASGDGLAYMWSWGRRIGGVSDPGSAAQATAYVLAARDAGPGRPWPLDQEDLIGPGTAHAARVYDYWLGGKDHFPADRMVAERVADVYPQIRGAAGGNRAFHQREAAWMAL